MTPRATQAGGRYGWKNIKVDRPPRDEFDLVVLVTLTCDCGKGGRVALPAARIGGEWVISHFDHTFEIDYWLRLPDFPEPCGQVH